MLRRQSVIDRDHDTTHGGGEQPAAGIVRFDGPEHPFPAALDDAMTAYLWVRENCDHLSRAVNVDRSRIVVGGNSMGGNLVAVLTHDCQRQYGVDHQQ